MDDISRYKIIGDVYEIQEDGTLVHVPKHKVLSRMSYAHERYVIVDKKVPLMPPEAVYMGIGMVLITLTLWVAVWLLAKGWLV